MTEQVAAETERLLRRFADSSSRLVGGGSFALDTPPNAPAVWGAGSEVLWAAGEPLVIVGPDGTGKTTLALRLALALTGLRGARVLGYPVARTERPVLYVAADRPRQIQRAVRRMVDEPDREDLDARLLVWRGPLKVDLVREPATALADWIERFGAGTVILDSLGALVPGLAKDEIGQAVAIAWSEAVVRGVEVAVLYHPRKATAENKRPDSLADVYGSRWLTAAAGSVLSLWGEPGDLIVTVRHLKQPAADVGPFRVTIDHEAGELTVAEGTDLLSVLRAANRGLTAQDGARILYGTRNPTASEVERVRRRLDGLVRGGRASRQDSRREGGRIAPTVYFPATQPGLTPPD